MREQVSLQVQDTPCVFLQDDAEGLQCQEQINRSIYWADGYVLVFSVMDPGSYRTVTPLYQHVRHIHPGGSIPLIVVGNKSDLPRARAVSAAEGEALAAELGAAYFEEVSRALGARATGRNAGGGLHLARPKSPNMQELKRRFRQALSARVRAAPAV
ncbi:hypothetical protein SKAU_G00270690 [Synaphobranchus kaupii]|uniref:small monomeric GTPase n=1 Tax=Synaphobranchus kaupii TaxID=118154 RepID=A0A9Q1IPM5_SYNKA|nr:hypothetical protein SKAU_G00270690 [Synaphobranchus kaupii]